MTDRNKILLGLLGGTVIGLAAAIIFAPDKGQETRKKIVDAAKDLSNKFMGNQSEMAERSNGSGSPKYKGRQ